MDDIIKAIFSAPVATLFIIAGLVFLFIAVVGKVSGKIETDVRGRAASGLLGLIFIVMGLTMNFAQRPPNPDNERQKGPVLPQPTKASKPANKEVQATSEGAAVTRDKEPNNVAPAANPINEGIRVRGSLSTGRDRDFFKVITSGYKTRVILRQLSGSCCKDVVIYNDVERLIKSSTGAPGTTISFTFKSHPGRGYYVVVAAFTFGGPYELEVRNE